MELKPVLATIIFCAVIVGCFVFQSITTKRERNAAWRRFWHVVLAFGAGGFMVSLIAHGTFPAPCC